MTQVIVVVLTLFSLVSSLHVLLHKRSPRAALGWIVCCWTIPGVGATLYWILGVNRVRTRARKLYEHWRRSSPLRPPELEIPDGVELSPEDLRELRQLIRISDKMSSCALLPGNRVEPLFNGEEAYPAMLLAIESARKHIYLCSYIFKTDWTGSRFVDALDGARRRGVEVRVLIDGVGDFYSFKRVSKNLRRRGIRVERFLPPRLLRLNLNLNLRNHRKILVIDGERCFTGGMNIADDHMAAEVDNPNRIIDLHFLIEGPAALQLEAAFLEDWSFVTGKPCEWETPEFPEPRGDAFCRGIIDGPNENLGRLLWIILAALGAARRHVRIMTPYFIPSAELLTALVTASLRGVKIEILLPAKSNLPPVDWASRAFLWEVLEHEIEVYHQPAPFVHSKLILVDDLYALVGSANLDPRSLRLNFEFNLEVFDREFVTRMKEHFDGCRDAAHRTTLAEMDGRPLPYKIRDAAAKLFSPYL